MYVSANNKIFLLAQTNTNVISNTNVIPMLTNTLNNITSQDLQIHEINSSERIMKHTVQNEVTIYHIV